MLVTESQHHEMIVQVITVRLVQTQNHGNFRPADGAPTVGGEIWCSFLSTHAFLLGNGQTYATRGVLYYRASRIFMARIFSVPDLKCIRQTDMVKGKASPYSLTAQPPRELLPILLHGEQRHNGCEQFA